MDQLFGLLKTLYFDNLEVLWEERLSDPTIKETITRNDIGLLLFGGKSGSRAESPTLQNAMAAAFTPERIKHVWDKKVGIFPNFTRAALNSKKIRHEITVDDQGEVDLDADPVSQYLMDLNTMNTTCCDILSSTGFNGDLLRLQLPLRKTSVRKYNLTRPHTKERQEAITAAKTQGGLFLRTGGATLNSDDFFKAQERGKIKAELQELTQTKKDRSDAELRERTAFLIIHTEKADVNFTSKELQVLIAWKTGKPCPSAVTLKPKRRELWDKVKDSTAPVYEAWTEADEDRLKLLTEKAEGEININDTELGRLIQTNKHQLFASVAHMGEEEKEELRKRLENDREG
jgi:hypothetical protein